VKVPVAIAQDWIERAREHGHRLAQWYASPSGAASLSRTRSGDRGTEKNPARLGLGKLGEVVVAVHFNLPPETTVNWQHWHGGDGGADLVIGEKKVDVKTTEAGKRWLVWSRNVNDLFYTKKFDVLAGVSVLEHDWTQAWVDGFISKQDFYIRKGIADGRGSGEGLERGTWFVPKAILIDIKRFAMYGPIPSLPLCAHCRGHAHIHNVVMKDRERGVFAVWLHSECVDGYVRALDRPSK
jgi:hypothetical protein